MIKFNCDIISYVFTTTSVPFYFGKNACSVLHTCGCTIVGMKLCRSNKEMRFSCVAPLRTFLFGKHKKLDNHVTV